MQVLPAAQAPAAAPQLTISPQLLSALPHWAPAQAARLSGVQVWPMVQSYWQPFSL